MENITFKVNGKELTVRADPRMRLLDLLRGDLGLKGAKQGCDGGECGACSVIIDGEVEMSCLVQVGKVRGRSITTIEGLGTPEDPHPIQRAFVEVGAVQCGYCTPGMVIAAKGLLDKNPRPRPEEIKKALAPNLCRCTGYARIVQGVELASGYIRGEGAAAPILAGGGIGRSFWGFNAFEKACGSTIYSADMEMEGMLHGAVLRSPHAHAEILGIDTSDALAMDGVEAVLTAKDVTGINNHGRFFKDQPVLCGDKVRYVGDMVALVMAHSEKIANKALNKVKVDYRPIGSVFDPFEALKDGAPKIYEKGNLCYVQKVPKGDVERGFAESDVIVEETFITPFNEHAYIEPEAGVAYIDGEGRVTVCAGTQNPHFVQAEVARCLGLELERVRVIQMPTGGGFGGKLDISVHIVIALAALKLGRPVRLVFTRKESFLTTGKRHPFHMRYKIGAKKGGEFTALKAEVVANTGAYTGFGPGVMTRAALHAAGPYCFPNVAIEVKAVYTNNPSCGAMRGFGAPQVTTALESIIDMLAERLGIDPLELRYINGFQRGHQIPTGETLSTVVPFKRTIEAVKQQYASMGRSGRWLKKEAIGPGKGDERFKRGLGIGCNWFGIGMTGLQNPGQAIARLEQDGAIHIFTGAADIGQGITTGLAQIASQIFNLPLNRIIMSTTDTSEAPNSGPTSAMRQMYFSGNAVYEASCKLKELMIDYASKMLEEKSENIALDGGHLLSLNYPSHKISFEKLASACAREKVELRTTAKYDPGITHFDHEKGQGVPYPAYVYGTQLAEVQVDTQTGEVKLLRVVAAHDVGKAINPLMCAGQIEGSIVMALGFALMEEFVPGKTANFHNYKIPTISDYPEMKIIFIEEPEPSGPFGAKGVGESAGIATAGAILNAIYDATGVRICDLPATPDKILKGLAQLRRRD